MKKNKLNLLVLAGMLGMLQSQAMAAPVENNSTKTQETKKDCEVPSIFVIDQRGESRLTSDVKLLTYVDEEGNTSVCGTREEGSTLLKMRREGDILITTWYAIGAQLIKNQEPGQYFIKDEEYGILR